jgi:nucleoside-diphosphate-sugar epimerase
MDMQPKERILDRRRWFVTGATGHLGSYFVRMLVGAEQEVAILLRQDSDLWRIRDIQKSVVPIQGDLTHSTLWRDEFLKYGPEVVVHFGWDGITAEARDSGDQMTCNVVATLQLLELIRDAGVRVFVGAGSQAEYGPHPNRIRESSAANPESPYGVAKYCLSLLVSNYCDSVGIRGLWLRVFSVYGPMDNSHHMLPTLISNLLRGRHTPLTTAEQMWDYLHVEDAARAFYAAATSPDAHGVYNVASGEAVRLRTVIEMVRDEIDRSLPLTFGEIACGTGRVAHLEGDIEKLKRATGWSPQITIAQGIAQTVAWYKQALSSQS